MGVKVVQGTLSVCWSVFKTIRNLFFLLFTLVGHIPLSLLFVLKKIVDFFALKICKDYSVMQVMDYLSLLGMDADIQEANSKDINANLGISCVIKGKVDAYEFFDNFVTNVVNTDLNSPSDMNLEHPHIRFYQNVKKFGGYWYFKTVVKELKCEDQLTYLTLQSDSESSGEEEVCKWLALRYKKEVPLWAILLIYREKTQDTIFVIKVHHAIVDGYSMLHILDLLTNTKYKYQVKDFNDSKWEKLKILVDSVYNTLEYNVKMMSVVPKSPIAKREDQEIFLTYVSIPISAVKDIRAKAGVRFQAVMLHLMRDYIKGLLNNILEEKEIPDKVVITNSLAWPKHPRVVLCNHQTGAAFGFNDMNKTEAPNKKILTDINDMFEYYHTQHLDKASHFLSATFAYIPRFFMSMKWIQKPTLDKITAAYVHLIGSEEYSQVFGAECSDVHLFCTPPRQKGVTVTCLTTSKEVRLSIMGPKWIFPSQEKADKFSHECVQRIISELTASVTETHIYS